MRTHYFKKTVALGVLFTIAALHIGQIAYAAKAPTVVVLFGDSTSLGDNIEYRRKYGKTYFWNGRTDRGVPTTRLSEILESSGRTNIVSNMGYGATPSGVGNLPTNQNSGLERIRKNLRKVRNDFRGKSYIALIMYGINDRANDIPASTTGYNSAELARIANDEGFTAVVSTILPCDTCSFSVNEINRSIVYWVNTRIQSGADTHFVNNHDSVRRLWNTGYVDPDGVHPTDEGYAAIAQSWFDLKLNELIPEDKTIDLNSILYLLLDSDD